MDRPVLMSAPMVRALLDGKKSQTRRVCKDQDDGLQWKHVEDVATWPENWDGKKALPYTGWIVKYPNLGLWLPRTCPYGAAGGILWVREAFRKIIGDTHGWIETDYRATYESGARMGDHLGVRPKWSPSIHMPREASRITLKITDVRVERLHDISPDDAAAEGWPGPDAAGTIRSSYPIAWYSHLWDEINGNGSWERNDWVWALSFEVIK